MRVDELAWNFEQLVREDGVRHNNCAKAAAELRAKVQAGNGEGLVARRVSVGFAWAT